MDKDLQIKLLKKTMKKMAKFLRNNPPSILDKKQLELNGVPYEDFIFLLVNGLERDPEGKEYIYYFWNKTLKEEGADI